MAFQFPGVNVVGGLGSLAAVDGLVEYCHSA